MTNGNKFTIIDCSIYWVVIEIMASQFPFFLYWMKFPSSYKNPTGPFVLWVPILPSLYRICIIFLFLLFSASLFDLILSHNYFNKVQCFPNKKKNKALTTNASPILFLILPPSSCTPMRNSINVFPPFNLLYTVQPEWFC